MYGKQQKCIQVNAKFTICIAANVVVAIAVRLVFVIVVEVICCMNSSRQQQYKCTQMEKQKTKKAATERHTEN